MTRGCRRGARGRGGSGGTRLRQGYGGASGTSGRVSVMGWGGVGDAVRARIRWHEVAGPCGNDVSYAASGVDDVVFVARDQMNVKVRHRLSCRFSNVDPDVEAVGKVFGRGGFASDGKGGEKLDLLVARSVDDGDGRSLKACKC